MESARPMSERMDWYKDRDVEVFTHKVQRRRSIVVADVHLIATAGDGEAVFEIGDLRHGQIRRRTVAAGEMPIRHWRSLTERCYALGQDGSRRVYARSIFFRCHVGSRCRGGDDIRRQRVCEYLHRFRMRRFDCVVDARCSLSQLKDLRVGKSVVYAERNDLDARNGGRRA
jgi:hypothetical protein